MVTMGSHISTPNLTLYCIYDTMKVEADIA